MAGVLSKLRELHAKVVDSWDHTEWCNECKTEWPCLTVKVIDGDEDELVKKEVEE